MPTKQIVCASAPLEPPAASTTFEALPRQPSRNSSALSPAVVGAGAPTGDERTDSTAPRATTLEIQPSYFRACWLAFAVLHVVSIAVFAGSIGITRYLQVKDTGYILNLLGELTWYFLEYTVLANAILLTGHLFGLLKMLALSLYFNRLLFTAPENTNLTQRSRVQPTSTSRRYSVLESQRLRLQSNRTWRTVSSGVDRHFGRHGSFGIEGTLYDRVYGVLEAISVMVRVFQAYRISTWIPRLWITRMFALLAVFSCFSVPLIKLFVVEPRLKQRVTLLAMDLAFDFVTSTVIPTAIFVPYVLEYDPALVDFPLVNYYHDTWFVQAVSENRQTFVTSWVDMFTKAYPKLSCLLTISLLKTCLSQAALNRARRSAAQKVVQPKSASLTKRKVPSSRNLPSEAIAAVLRSVSSFRPLRRLPSMADIHTRTTTAWCQRSVSKAYWLENGFFIFAGVAVLVIQAYSFTAASHQSHRACLLELNPWFSSAPHCAVFEVRCRHTIMSDGNAADLDTFFSGVRPDAVQELIFSSCPRLQMPSVIAQFPNLHMIKIYNCTIDAWDGAATLTEANHPNIQMVYISNTNMTAVPPGLLADDFPRMLTDIEFCGTNLTGLPDEVTDKWAAVYYFVFERSPGVTEYPPAIVPLQIAYVSLAGNSIRHIPDDLLANQAYWNLYLSHNPLEALPAQVGDISKLAKLHVRSTVVANLPMWMTERRDASGDPPEQTSVAAGSSKLCTGVGDSATLRDGVVASPQFDVSCAPSKGSIADCMYPLEAEIQWRAHASR